MRLKSLILAAACACAALGAPATAPAEAADFGVRRAHVGWGEVHAVRHYGYHRDRYYYGDPYAYYYRQPRYYPYYNSGYWRPAHEMCCGRRLRFPIPQYYQAWGYPNPYYPVHRRHHRRHW